MRTSQCLVIEFTKITYCRCIAIPTQCGRGRRNFSVFSATFVVLPVISNISPGTVYRTVLVLDKSSYC
jgi:hypothetical protein